MKKKNPLFVVTNQGKTVEQATGIIDALIKKLGLGPVIQFFEMMIETIISSISNYASLVVANDMLETLITQMMEFQTLVETSFAPYKEMANERIEQALKKLEDFQKLTGIRGVF